MFFHDFTNKKDRLWLCCLFWSSFLVTSFSQIFWKGIRFWLSSGDMAKIHSSIHEPVSCFFFLNFREKHRRPKSYFVIASASLHTFQIVGTTHEWIWMIMFQSKKFHELIAAIDQTNLLLFRQGHHKGRVVSGVFCCGMLGSVECCDPKLRWCF